MIDEAAFEAYRRELHVHCYRMVGSFDEAEDLVQETFLRVWKARERFSGNVRAWLYKVATNACLDALRRSRRRAGASFALQRARATLDERTPLPAEPTGDERALLDRYIDVHERADASAVAALVAEDIRITMPPHPWLFEGLEAIRPLIEEGLTEAGEWRVVPTAANRMPTAACYLRAPGDTEFRAFKFDVLRIEAGRIMEITTFDAKLFDAFGLPPTVPS